METREILLKADRVTVTFEMALVPIRPNFTGAGVEIISRRCRPAEIVHADAADADCPKKSMTFGQ
jgi:hypothetical protein